MPSWDVTGTWAGEYWYDPNPEFPVHPPRTGFTLIARQGWFGRFRGTIQDALVSGQLLEAGIAGRVTRSGVKFRKRYPVSWVWLGDRIATFGEQVEADHGFRLDTEPAPAPIWYRGEYDAVANTAAGNWEIHPQWVQCYSDGQPLGFAIPRYSGGWQMARQTG